MKRPGLLFAVIYSLLAACQSAATSVRSPAMPVSNWVINGDSTTINATSFEYRGTGIFLKVDGYHSLFYLTSTAGIPANGRYNFDLWGTPDPKYLDIYFELWGDSKGITAYLPLDSGYMDIHRANGILSLKMPPTRFVNKRDSTDIARIKADLFVPLQ